MTETNSSLLPPPPRPRSRRSRRAGATALLWSAPAIIAGVALAAFDPSPLRAVRDLAFDSFMALKPRVYDADAPVRVVDIDEESLRRMGQWPWPRTILARLVTAIGDAGAAAIALDLLFAEPDRTSLEQIVAGMEASPARDDLARVARERKTTNDDALADAMKRYPVAIGLAVAQSGGEKPPQRVGLVWQGDPGGDFLPQVPARATLPLPGLMESAAGLGALNFLPDRDTIVRRAPSLLMIDGVATPSLSMEALRLAQQASTYLVKASNASGAEAFGQQTGVVSVRNGDIAIDTERDGQIRVYYAGFQPQRRIPAWRILAGDVAPDELRGRIVFVGASAPALADIRATPLQPDAPGVEVHAEAIEHILSGGRLARPDYAVGVEITAIVLGGLLAALVSALCAPLLGAALAFALATSFALGSWLFFARAGLLFDPATPPLAVLAAFASATIAAYRRTEKDRAQIRDAFGRYVSPAVIEALAADPSKLRLGGDIRQVTVLFSDIRNFTQRSERLPANEVVHFLNTVHTPMSDAVMRFGGTVDKYIGDGLMAFWNAPLDDPDHVRNALRAALAMIEELPNISARLSLEQPGDAPPLGLGIGLHTGQACVGNLGSARRFDYSIVGDTVNSAARIEPLCKDYGAQIIVSEAIVAAAPSFAYIEIDAVALRGRQAATRVFAVLGDEKRARDSSFLAFKELHERALRAVRDADQNAESLISECESAAPEPGLALTYARWRKRLAAPIRDGA
ncbi:MAG: hypothetical protein BGP06_13355 [Rhizobiales bacterium 65-9]|nr:MAG: hypothetical protein BGP06_13355 [Rhizobiales bacterium 65-9]